MTEVPKDGQDNPDPGERTGATAGPLDGAFFNRPTLTVARELLGCHLCRRIDGEVIRWRLTETEAYDGPEDRASHARSGRTKRTAVMFGAAGIWYVYLCYGIHWLLNVVTGPEAYPAAVLIRGTAEVSGPGRLTRALSIDGSLNQRPSAPQSGLWIDPGGPDSGEVIRTGPRIGVAYAGPDWAQRPYRFQLQPSEGEPGGRR
jgi:DNA-3-methyladenine glycosylase